MSMTELSAQALWTKIKRRGPYPHDRQGGGTWPRQVVGYRNINRPIALSAEHKQRKGMTDAMASQGGRHSNPGTLRPSENGIPERSVAE